MTGRVIDGFVSDRRRWSIDLAPLAGSLEVFYAREVEGMLYVTLTHNGYARDVAGKTRYLAAFDVARARVRWVSPARV